MKTNWEHQKEAVTTDQKFRVEDEHLREVDKRHVKQSRDKSGPVPGQEKEEGFDRVDAGGDED